MGFWPGSCLPLAWKDSEGNSILPPIMPNTGCVCRSWTKVSLWSAPIEFKLGLYCRCKTHDPLRGARVEVGHSIVLN